MHSCSSCTKDPAKHFAHLSRPCERPSILIFLQTRVQHVVVSAFCVCFEQLSDNNWSNVYKVWVVTQSCVDFGTLLSSPFILASNPVFFCQQKVRRQTNGPRSGF